MYFFTEIGSGRLFAEAQHGQEMTFGELGGGEDDPLNLSREERSRPEVAPRPQLKIDNTFTGQGDCINEPLRPACRAGTNPLFSGDFYSVRVE